MIIQQRTVASIIDSIDIYVKKIKTATDTANNVTFNEQRIKNAELRTQWRDDARTANTEYMNEKERLWKCRTKFGFRKYTRKETQDMARAAIPKVPIYDIIEYHTIGYGATYTILSNLLHNLNLLDDDQTVILTIEQAIALKEVIGNI